MNPLPISHFAADEMLNDSRAATALAFEIAVAATGETAQSDIYSEHEGCCASSALAGRTHTNNNDKPLI